MQRIREIDGLRAIAVGLVFTVHSIPEYFPGGWVGVDLFFVVSGFVITRSLKSEPSLGHFYVKRARRILPALFGVCLGALVLGARPFEVAASAGSFMNWARAFGYTTGGLMGHAWSLSIEEQFYLIWPALFLFIRKPVPVLIAFVVAVFVWRLDFTNEVRLYNGLDTHSDGLALGCLLAFVGNKFPRWSWPLPVITLLAVVAIGPRFNIGIPIASLASFCLVSILSEEEFAILRQPIVQWGGSRSYSLYLWHLPIFLTIFAEGWPTRYSMPVAILLTCIAAELSWRYLERLKFPTLPARPGISPKALRTTECESQTDAENRP